MMTIEDFRELTAELFWGKDVKKIMCCTTERMFKQLLEVFKSKIYPLKSFSSGDLIQVTLSISKCVKLKTECEVPHDYQTIIHYLHGDPIDVDSFYTNSGIKGTYSFYDDLFCSKKFGASGVKPVLILSTDTFEKVESDFQLYQQLWVSSHLPAIFKTAGMKHELIYDNDEVCGIIFFITPEWLLSYVT